MKIAFINLYSGVDDRGAESFAHDLAVELARNHRVTFFSGGEFKLPGCRIVAVKSFVAQPQQGFTGKIHRDLPKRFFLDPASLAVALFTLRVSPFLWKERYDVIIPLNGFWQVLILKILQIFKGTKILITGHSGPGWDEKWNLYLRPDVFVATTEPTAQWAKSVSPWTRVAVIPYGINIETYARAKPLRLELERPIVLCSSAFVPYKRVHLAVKAVAKLAKGSLLHLGAGPLKDEAVSLGERLLGKGRFLSLSVPHHEMPRYYASCDLVTLPSSPQENSPMTFQEAMAAGKMTVATDAPRPRWILGEVGVFVDPENGEKYAAAIRKALKISDDRKIALQAKKYSWSEVSRQYEKLLLTL